MNSELNQYPELVEGLVNAIHARNRVSLETSFDLISEYGWDRGPTLIISSATSSVIEAIHEGGLKSTFSKEWILDWQTYVENLHGSWGKVPSNLVRTVILIARGDKATIMDNSQSARAIWQVMFLDSVAHKKFGVDEDQVMNFFGAIFAQAQEFLIQMANKGLLSFEP